MRVCTDGRTDLVDESYRACDGNDHECVASIEGERGGPIGYETCSLRRENVTLSGSVDCLIPSAERSRSSSPFFNAIEEGERRGDEKDTTHVVEEAGRRQCMTIEEEPVSARFHDISSESPQVATSNQNDENGHTRGGHSTVGQVARCVGSDGVGLTESPSTSDDVPQAVQPETRPEESDEDLTQALLLLHRLADDNLLENEMSGDAPSTQNRQSCIEGPKGKIDPDKVTARDCLVTTLERLGDLCGRFDALTSPCQGLIKKEVPPAIIRILRKLTHVKRPQPSQETAGDTILPVAPASQEQLVFLQSCYVLASLSYQSDSDTKSTIASSGGMDALLTVMRMQLDEEHIQMFSCGTLSNLLIDNESNARLFQSAGGIEVVVAAMERHSCSSHVQEWALRTLNNVCHYEALCPHVVNAGGLRVIQEAVRVASRHPSEVETTESTYCRTWAIEVLSETVASLEQ